MIGQDGSVETQPEIAAIAVGVNAITHCSPGEAESRSSCAAGEGLGQGSTLKGAVKVDFADFPFGSVHATQRPSRNNWVSRAPCSVGCCADCPVREVVGLEASVLNQVCARLRRKQQ